MTIDFEVSVVPISNTVSMYNFKKITVNLHTGILLFYSNTDILAYWLITTFIYIFTMTQQNVHVLFASILHHESR